MTTAYHHIISTNSYIHFYRVHPSYSVILNHADGSGSPPIDPVPKCNMLKYRIPVETVTIWQAWGYVSTGQRAKIMVYDL